MLIDIILIKGSIVILILRSNSNIYIGLINMYRYINIIIGLIVINKYILNINYISIWIYSKLIYLNVIIFIIIIAGLYILIELNYILN